jgi:hypothetical protein
MEKAWAMAKSENVLESAMVNRRRPEEETFLRLLRGRN